MLEEALSGEQRQRQSGHLATRGAAELDRRELVVLLLSVGAVALARAYGIKDVRDLGDEVRRWLPSHQTLRSQVEPGAEQLKRSISNTIDAAKIDETFKATTIGRYLSKQGERSVKAQKDAKMEQWERDAIEKLQAMEKDTTPGFGGAKK